MAWSWCHTVEALEYARDRVLDMTDNEVERAIGFVKAESPDYMDGAPYCEREALWEYAESHRTCSNGGWDCYIDKQGYVTVPFGPEGE